MACERAGGWDAEDVPAVALGREEDDCAVRDGAGGCEAEVPAEGDGPAAAGGDVVCTPGDVV